MDDTADPERRFYLSQLRGRSLVVAERGRGSTQTVDPVIRHLGEAGAMVVHVHDGAPPRFGTNVAVPHSGWSDDLAGVCWSALRRDSVVHLGVTDSADAMQVGVRAAARLRPFKLVLVDPAGPPADDLDRSFRVIDPTAPEGEPLRQAAQEALRAGVGSVNACSPASLEAELLTYQGAGVLYTRERYGEVSPLGLDEYRSAERLIASGVEEGYLKPRSDSELAHLLMAGYAARVDPDHLAGFAALLRAPYRAHAMAEVCALTTISRFAGGGVGGMLVTRMVADAAAAGLSGVFACTTSPAAATFFASHGFNAASHEDVPAVKWAGYDGARRRAVQVLLRDLSQA